MNPPKKKPRLRLVRTKPPQPRRASRSRRLLTSAEVEQIREEMKFNAVASLLGGLLAAFFVGLAEASKVKPPTPPPVPPPKTHSCDRARSVDVIHITAHCLCDCVSCTLARWPKALQ